MTTQTKEGFQKCCAEEIKNIWEAFGGSMNIVHYTSTCSTCKHFIGLTQTSIKEAQEFLKEYGLSYDNKKTKI